MGLQSQTQLSTNTHTRVLNTTPFSDTCKQISSPVFGLLFFSFFCLFFWRTVYAEKQNFKFCWSLIYHISAMVCIFYDQKNFYILQSYNMSSMFASKYFIILTFKFRSVIYFKLVFIYDVQFVFSKWIYSFSSTNFWKWFTSSVE